MSLSFRSLVPGLVLAALPGCESFTGVSPADTPRVEIELAVVFERGFTGAFVDVGPSSALLRSVKDAVRDKADFGLRFYATPSENYGARDRRPPYLMTIKLTSLDILFEDKTIKEEVPTEAGTEAEAGAEPAEPQVITRVVTSVDKINASVDAAIERRRADAPPLIVASSRASSQVTPTAEANGSGRYVPKYDGDAPSVPDVFEDDVVRAVQSAANKALKAMRTAIDREFAPESPADTGEDREDGA